MIYSLNNNCFRNYFERQNGDGSALLGHNYKLDSLSAESGMPSQALPHEINIVPTRSETDGDLKCDAEIS